MPNNKTPRADDPLAHPAIAAMSERQLADLPLSALLQAAYSGASADRFHKTNRTDTNRKT